MKAYKIPENNLGFFQLLVSFEELKIRLHKENRIITLYMKSPYCTRNVLYDHHMDMLPVPHDITHILSLPKREEAVRLYLEKNKEYVSYFKFPENPLNFVNIGIDHHRNGNIIYLNHHSGKYITIDQTFVYCGGH